MFKSWGSRKTLVLRGGQNARLAARLTGYKIDIRPASAPEPAEEEPAAEEEEVIEVEE